MLLALLCGAFEVWSGEVVTPVFCELQLISNDAFIALQPGQKKIDASIGPDGHITAIAYMGLDGLDRYALMKAPERPVELLLREDDPLMVDGRVETVQALDYLEAGPQGRVVIQARSGAGDRLIIVGGAGGLEILAATGQAYDGSVLAFNLWRHTVRFNSIGQLAITGCARAESSECRDYLWINSVTPGTGLQLTGKPWPGLPVGQVVASLYDPKGFPFNDAGQALVEAVLENSISGPDALLFIDGQEVLPIAVEGAQAPGLPAGEVYSGIFDWRSLAENGWIALRGALNSGDIAPNQIVTCLLAGQRGDLQLIARSGNEIPGRPGYSWALLSKPAISSDGTVIFKAYAVNLEAPDYYTELWQWRAGQLTSLATGRELVGGGGQTDFVDISDPIQSPTGAIFYTVFLGSNGGELFEIWMFDPETHTSTLVAPHQGQITLPNDKVGELISASLRSVSDDRERPWFDNQGRFLADLVVHRDNVNLDCVALIDPGALRPPAPVTIRLHRVTSITPDNLVLGRTSPDAPIVPTPLTSRLATQPEVGKGLVADGVTPLLLSFEVTGAVDDRFTSFGLKAMVVSGGEVVLDGQSLNDLTSRLHWLDVSRDFEEGTWLDLAQPANNQNALPTSGTGQKRYAYLEAIPSDALELANGSVEIQVELSVYAVHAPDQVVGQRTIRLRKPPVTLVHGYNTDGAWGTEFKRIIGRSRAWDEANDADNFVRTVTYGQNKPIFISGTLSAQARQLVANAWWGLLGTGWIDEFLINHENTLKPLAELVPMLHAALFQSLNGLQPHWAFTRHDVIAHSQGGLLIRMLSSERSFHPSYPAYQSPDNFYRGRFHRVVTMGSPHNGSRLLGYVLMLDRNASWAKLLPKTIATASVFTGLAQEKFDPFGRQIVNLNTSFQWRPDPDAKFHLVRTTINHGSSPSFLDGTILSLLLGLNPEQGAIVLPRGFDGVVDFDSMGALGDTQPTPANVFTLPVNHIVSHSGPEKLFSDHYAGPLAVSQTSSDAVAEQALGALDQSNDARFGRFVVPELLPESVRLQMKRLAEVKRLEVDHAAALLVSGGIELLRSKVFEEANGERVVFEFALQSPDRFPGSDVFWFVDTYGPPDAPVDSVTLTVSDPAAGSAEVRVAQSYLGDVVLRACYFDLSGTLTPARTTLVTSHEPEAALAEMTVMPGGGELTAGAGLVPTFLMIYANDQLLTRYVANGAFSVESSNPAVMDVSDPTYWRAVGPGNATVTTSYHGMTSVAEFTIHAPTDGFPAGPPPTDTDGDGAADLLEEAFGSNPAVQDLPRQPRAILGSHDGQTVPVLEVPVFADGQDEGNGVYTAGGFLYVIETSEDLHTWRPADPSVVYLPPTADGPGRDLVRALIGSASTRFLRVLVVKDE